MPREIIDAGTVDAGTVDAGIVDAGAIDAGAIDAGAIDAGTIDAGASDAGTSDAGTSDAGTSDAGTFLPELFPLAMTIKATGGIKEPDLTTRINRMAPYPIIHSPGSAEKSARIRRQYPSKVITMQDAWGGISPDRDYDTLWPGHCLMRAGTSLTVDLQPTDTTFQVADRTLLFTGNGKDIHTWSISQKTLLLYALGSDGKPDWSTFEHVTLADAQTAGDNVVTVSRAAFSSTAHSFVHGRTVVAAHERFWDDQWMVNLSLDSPRGGPDNLTGAEWFARHIASNLTHTGADGVEMDVGRWTFGNSARHPVDANNDGVADFGYLDGVNSFGLGGQVLVRELRALLGPQAIIQADSADALHGVRGWKYLNGVQLEAFPNGNDFDLISQALTHLRRWVTRVEQRPYSYAYGKVSTTTFSGETMPDGSSTDWHFRISFAADLLVGMPHPFLSTKGIVDPESGERTWEEFADVYDWDEYHAGDLGDWCWLGRPLGEATQDLSALGPNLLNSATFACEQAAGFAATCTPVADGVTVNVTGNPPNVPPETLWFGVKWASHSAVPLTAGQEYTLSYEARGDDSWQYHGATFDSVPRAVMIDVPHVSREGQPLGQLVDPTWQKYLVSFVSTGSTVPPSFGVSEQQGTTSLRRLKLQAGTAEHWVREFEGGLVLFNGGATDWLAKLPAGQWSRFKGTQSPTVNTGLAVTGTELTVPARDAIILIRLPIPLTPRCTAQRP